MQAVVFAAKVANSLDEMLIATNQHTLVAMVGTTEVCLRSVAAEFQADDVGKTAQRDAIRKILGSHGYLRLVKLDDLYLPVDHYKPQLKQPASRPDQHSTRVTSQEDKEAVLPYSAAVSTTLPAMAHAPEAVKDVPTQSKLGKRTRESKKAEPKIKKKKERAQSEMSPNLITIDLTDESPSGEDSFRKIASRRSL